MKKSLCFFIILLILSTCKNNKHPVPYVKVDFTIDIISTFYNELTSVGGWVYVTGGYKGIIIYRLSMDNFLSYDRSCTFDPSNPCERVVMEQSGLSLIDSCCTSRFNILDGSVISGPAKFALRSYQTHFDGRFLRIYN